MNDPPDVTGSKIAEDESRDGGCGMGDAGWELRKKEAKRPRSESL